MDAAFGESWVTTPADITSQHWVFPRTVCSKLLLVAVFSCTAVVAQPPGKKEAPDTKESGDVTFRTGVKVVLVPVVVRDSRGRPVGGLHVEDFQLFDKGKRQTINSFTAVTHDGVATEGHSTKPHSTESHSTERYPVAAASSGAAEPGSVSARPVAQQSVAYVFDDVNTGFAELVRVRQAALRHLQTGLPAGEVAGVYTFSGRTTLPFTNDRAKLEDAVNQIRVSLTGGHGEANPCPYVSYYLADFIVRMNDSRALEAVTRQTMDCANLGHELAQHIAEGAARREVHIGEHDTHVWVATLRRVIRLLEERPAPRVLVLASSGFYAETPSGIKAVADTLDLAARANVTISTLHARGVYTTAPADASRRNAPTSIEQEYYRRSAISEEGALEDLADGAGGAYFRHNNDLAAGFGLLVAPPQYSYVLGFSPASLKLDGSFHALKIRLPDRRGVSIQARPGYYAPPLPKKGRPVDSVAEQFDDAVQSRDENTGIPVDAAVQVSQSGGTAATLFVMVKVHVKTLPFQQLDGRNHAVLTVVSVVFDEDGGYVAGSRNTINLMLRNESLAGKDDPTVDAQFNFQMKPGRYLVRVVVCGNEGNDLSARNVRVIVR
jgi:VWFA-related protein